MMFNLPLPGGTTGHAIGVGVAAIVLGPSLAVVAISMALLVQALFFGDGGITTYGANCFNMAVVGSYVAAGVYHLLTWRSGASTTRKTWAAGFAGYAAVNAAAFCAAVEFGIQPALFHDASGAPLYAPYPLSISLPAMMIGHLTVAGLAEFAVTAALAGYLHRSGIELAPPLLRKPAFTRLWAVLAVLLLLTPLGIFAVGSAWGEWKAPDFEDLDARRYIQAISGNRELPSQVPAGLKRLSALWKAPIADYSPQFFDNRPAGYLASAAIGIALLFLVVKGTLLLLKRERRSLLERTSHSLIDALESTLFAERCWSKHRFLQRTDARLKVFVALPLIVAGAASSGLLALFILFITVTAAVAASGVPVFPALTRIWTGVLLFTGTVALPALFLTPGPAAFTLFGFVVTETGLRSASLLLLRAATLATVCGSLVLTTPPAVLLSALRSLKVPSFIVASAGFTYRYLFFFLEAARNALEAREARTVAPLKRSMQRKMDTQTAAALLNRVFTMSGQVHDAMEARGFRGEVRLLEAEPLRPVHFVQGGLAVAASACFVWLAR